MANVSQRTRRDLSDVRIAVSRYDQVASLLVSLLILIGTAVAIMFVIWLTSRFVFLPRSVPVTLVENIAGRGDRPEGYERDLEPPGIEEMPELAEPQIDTALEAVTDLLSNTVSALDVLDTATTLNTEGTQGRGDNRPPGPLGEGDDIIPRWERWEVRWTSSSLAAYARQLDYFGIELGAAGGSNEVDYASNLSRATPTRRRAGPADEARLFMTWKGGSLIEFDRQLLRRAGIEIDNRVLFQFYPQVVEDRLAELEMANANGRPVQEFLKTIFEVVPAGRGYAFRVLEQRFRNVGR